MTDVPGLDLDQVAGWVRREHPGLLAAQPAATLLTGGRSNLTYLLDDGRRRLVLRRPPLGHVLATAHDMAREYRVLTALAGTGVPVPRPLAFCPDPTPTGAPFYLMEHVDGAVVRSAEQAAALGAPGRETLADRMIDTLADLHALDPDAVGLADFGRPEGFMARQVRRWAAQLDSSRSRELPGIDTLRDELAASVPAPARPGGAVVHGDFRLDNLIVSPDGDLQVRAVLDWEMATIGEPLADLGLLLAYWDGLGTVPGSGALGPATGFPPGRELARRYADRTGGAAAGLPWYVAFGYFKIAAILEGVHYRYILGRTVGPGFERVGAAVPGLVRAGLAALRDSE